MKNKLIRIIIFLLTLPILLSSNCLATEIIKKIEITGNRVNESTIRKHLGFSEGNTWDDSLIDKAKKRLYKLKIFKELEITSDYNKDLSGMVIKIKAVDGWFILPIPITSIKGGDQVFLLILTEQNYFRKAERITLFNSIRQGRLSSIFTYDLQHYSISVGAMDISETEYIYSDAGISNKVFNNGINKEKPENFGIVISDYKKMVLQPLLSGSILLTDYLKASAGIRSTSVNYTPGATGAIPTDHGTMNSVFLALSSDDNDPARDSDSIGRIFGMGMAEIREMVRKKTKVPSIWLWNCNLENSGRIVSSDFPFTKTSLSIAHKAVFKWKNDLTISSKFTGGTTLPPSQMPATNQRNGLKGYYAREFRGNSTINSYINYSYPFYLTELGYFSAEGFYDWGICFSDDNRFDRTGTGLNLSYRFWRFPIPIGLGYTYSFDDRNWQTILAIGGRF